MVKFFIVMSLEDSLTIFVTLGIERRDKRKSFFLEGGGKGRFTVGENREAY